MNDVSDVFKYTCLYTCLGYDPSKKPCAKFLEGGFCTLPSIFRCTEYVKIHEPTLSYSSIRLFSHCKRAFWYDWVMGLESMEKSLPLLMGTIASEVMAHLHSGITPLGHVRIIANMAKNYIQDGERVVAWPYAMIGFFNGYVALGYHTMRCRSEVNFTWSEPNYPKITGRIDRIPYPDHTTESISPDTIAYEDKYSQRPEWYEIYTLKDQLTTYFLGVNTLQRITARIMVHPDLRLGKNESPSDYAKRVEADVVARPKHYIRDLNFWRTEFDYKAYKWKMRMIANEIVGLMKYGFDAFYQDAQACFSPPCQFKPICSSNDVISDTLYKKKTRDYMNKGKAEPLYTGKEIKKEDKKIEEEVDSLWNI
jgi:hypothetical protein